MPEASRVGSDNLSMTSYSYHANYKQICIGNTETSGAPMTITNTLLEAR